MGQFVDGQFWDGLDVADPFVAGGADVFPTLDRDRNSAAVAGPLGAWVELAPAPTAVTSRAPAEHRIVVAKRDGAGAVGQHETG